MDLNTFYTVLATAAATLLGLLFIAIQPNIHRLSNDPQNRWKALAVSTFYTYTLILVMALFTFIPTFRPQTVLVASLMGIWRQLRTWLPVWQLTAQGRYERLRETFWMLVGPVLIYAGLIYSSSQLPQGKGDEATEANIATAFIVLLVIVLRNSWRLLVEIPSEHVNDSPTASCHDVTIQSNRSQV